MMADKNRFSMMAYSKQGFEFCHMQKKHLESVSKLESICFSKPLNVEKLSTYLLSYSIGSYVITLPDEKTKEPFVAGYCIYDLKYHYLKMRRFIINPNCRRLGLGSEMMMRILKKLNSKRSYVEITLRETNLQAQLFLKQNKFVAKKLLHQKFEDTNEDGYLMVYDLINKPKLAFK
jgi:ribosomal protein S18 acetylase RimI-like enzyme